MNYNVNAYNNSVGIPVAKTVLGKLSELNQKAKKEFVTITFFNDRVRVEGKNTRTTKVPKKIIGSGEELVKWIDHKISTAWA